MSICTPVRTLRGEGYYCRIYTVRTSRYSNLPRYRTYIEARHSHTTQTCWPQTDLDLGFLLLPASKASRLASRKSKSKRNFSRSSTGRKLWRQVVQS